MPDATAWWCAVPTRTARPGPSRAEGEQGLRVGLMQVKGAREDEVRALLEERERHGPFADLDELLRRVNLSIPTVEALASGGRLRPLGPGRRPHAPALGAPGGRAPGGAAPAHGPLRPGGAGDGDPGPDPGTPSRGPGPGPPRGRPPPGRPMSSGPATTCASGPWWWPRRPSSRRRANPCSSSPSRTRRPCARPWPSPTPIRRRKRPYRVGDVVPVAGRSVRQDGLAMLEVR